MRRHEEILFQRDAVKYLSAVVLMELRVRGASNGLLAAWQAEDMD